MRYTHAFSIIEMLVAAAVLAVLSVASLPEFSALCRQSNRKGAVNQLLNAFELARVTALASGTTSYVGFANEFLFNQEGSEYPYRAFIVFRERQETDPAGGFYVPLTKWMFLPGNIYFKRERLSVVGLPPDAVPYGLNLCDDSIPLLKAGDQLPSVAFGSNGAIQNPAVPEELRLFLYECFSKNDLSNTENSAPVCFKSITFQRFTGRALLDIGSIQ